MEDKEDIVQKPYYLKSRKCWYIWIGKGASRRQVNLGKDKEAAEAKYHQLMADASLKRTMKSDPGAIPVQKLLDEYLCWVEKHRKPATFDWYRSYLVPFGRFIGKRLTVDELEHQHVHGFVEKFHATSKPNTIHGVIRTITRAFNWAIKRQILKQSPLVGIEKPRPTGREMTISQADFDDLLLKATDQQERDLLEYLWETGTRAEEVVKIEARHVNLDNACIVLAASEGKKSLARTIYLTDRSMAIVTRLCHQHPTGPIFLNSRGKPWNKDSMKCRFRKYNMPGLCATVFRHSWVTRSLLAGIDPVTVGVLAGHKDLTMVAKRYSHLAKHPDYLKDQLTKLKKT